MTVPLREPFFLRGRKSVVQRAVIMSCVLGTLAAVAAWSMGLAAMLAGDYSAPPLIEYMGRPIAWCLATSLFIYGPLNAWNGRSAWWTFASASAGFLLMFIGCFYFHFSENRLGEEFRTLTGNRGTLSITTWSGLLQVRFHRLHLLAYLSTILAAAFPLAIGLLLATPGIPRFIPRPPWVPHEAVTAAAFFGSWFAALSIPWGLLFWWPPERNTLTADLP